MHTILCLFYKYFEVCLFTIYYYYNMYNTPLNNQFEMFTTMCVCAWRRKDEMNGQDGLIHSYSIRFCWNKKKGKCDYQLIY
jgi:hypothetical protein